MADQVAYEFVNHFYGVFDSNRAQLISLYSDESMLTFEDTQVLGANDIVNALKGMQFKETKHIVKTCDAQPSPNDGILVFVSGDVHIDGDVNPVKFSEVFNLQPTPDGSYFVLNDMMRLNYS